MDIATIDGLLDKARAQLDQVETDYLEATHRKRLLDVDLSDQDMRNLQGERLSAQEAYRRRRELLKQQVQVERKVGHCKLQRQRWLTEIERLCRVRKEQIQEAEQVAEGRRLRAEITRLQQQTVEWESKYRTLERQYDAVVRQLNAIPKVARVPQEA